MCQQSKSNSREELLSVAEEIAFAKALAANDKSLRDRALKKLRKWLLIKSNRNTKGIRFTEEGFMRIWKGLFYCVWMSDKPLIQEECVEFISNLLHCFTDAEDARKFIRCFFKSISNSWLNLDGHRMDKYLMLVRRFLRHILEYLRNVDWKEDIVNSICDDLTRSLQTAPLGLCLHLIEIYLEELSKAGRGSLGPKTVQEMIRPFADLMAVSSDQRIFKYLNDYIFFQLLRQSDEGLKYGAKFEVWKEMGFPEGDIDVIQEASDDEVFEEDNDESEEKESSDEDEDLPDISEGGPLDPRAGNVDVLLPPLDFDALAVVEYLNGLIKKKTTTTKARKAMNSICRKYERFAEGKYPLGIHKVEVPEIVDKEKLIEETAEELLKEEKAFKFERYLFKKRKKLVPSEAWEVTIADDDSSKNSLQKVSNKGVWKVQKPKKRKKELVSPVGSTMKKIKVILDESLLDPSSIEKLDSNPSLFSSENSGDNVSNNDDNVNNSDDNVNSLVTSNPKGTKVKSQSKLTKCWKPSKPKSKMLKKGNRRFAIEATKYIKQMMALREKERKKISKANKDWGLSNKWDTPANEQEVVIPFSPYEPNTSRKLLGTPGNEDDNLIMESRSLSGKKKVGFALSRNTAQEMKEHKKALKLSPNIPLNFEKKPVKGVLKSAAIGSPINPFALNSSMYE